MEQIYEHRAKALAEIFYYDLTNYGDINEATIVRAWELASDKYEIENKENDKHE
jgi:hypothetical protein